MIDLRQELQKQIQEQLDITLFVKSISAQNIQLSNQIFEIFQNSKSYVKFFLGLNSEKYKIVM